MEEPFKDGKHVWFTLGAAGQLHLIKGADGKIKYDKNEHLCFSVASIDDFIKKLDQQNIEYINWEGTAKAPRSEEHTSELQSLMRISYAVFCLKKKNKKHDNKQKQQHITQQHTIKHNTNKSQHTI